MTFTCQRCNRAANSDYVNGYVVNITVPSMLAPGGFEKTTRVVCRPCLREDEKPEKTTDPIPKTGSIIFVDFKAKKKIAVYDAFNGTIVQRMT